jgi:hypothetical protein
MTFACWLRDRIDGLRRERRRAQWRLYSRSPKGRARARRATDRYLRTAKGQIVTAICNYRRRRGNASL